jgi:hypothetical protein
MHTPSLAEHVDCLERGSTAYTRVVPIPLKLPMGRFSRHHRTGRALRQIYTAGRWPLRHKGFQQYRHLPAICLIMSTPRGPLQGER